MKMTITTNDGEVIEIIDHLEDEICLADRPPLDSLMDFIHKAVKTGLSIETSNHEKQD